MGLATGSVGTFSKQGSTGITGNVTISEGTGVTLTQSGNDVAIAAAGFSWGASIASTSGTGVTVTASNSSSAATNPLSLVIGDTQTQTLRALSINLGNANVAHTGIYIDAVSTSTTERGVHVDMTNGGQGVGFYAEMKDASTQTQAATAGTGLMVSVTPNESMMGVQVQEGNSNSIYLWSAVSSNIAGLKMTTLDPFSDSHAFRQLWLTHTRTGATGTRTTDVNTVAFSESYGAGTRTNNYDLFSIVRTTIANNASAAITEQGAVLYLQHVATQTSGTLTSQVNLLEMVQDADSTGFPIHITQAAVVSTNFKKIASFAGVTLWISDGTTPNGALSGTAGDVCFNGASSQAFYCTGTTNWTGM